MPEALRLVFLGPPGAGKGTQARMLAQELGILHLSTGDVLRSAVERGTPTGLRAKAFMDDGKLVPDAVVDAIVEERIAERDAAGGYILDGYPRTLPQAEVLAAMLANSGARLDAVVFLAVDDEVLVQRIRERREARADDREEVARERLRVYREHTEPLVAHYRAQGLLRQVDGGRTIDEVRDAVRAAVEGVRS